jgi:hypothetical protein
MFAAEILQSLIIDLEDTYGLSTEDYESISMADNFVENSLLEHLTICSLACSIVSGSNASEYSDSAQLVRTLEWALRICKFIGIKYLNLKWNTVGVDTLAKILIAFPDAQSIIEIGNLYLDCWWETVKNQFFVTNRVSSISEWVDAMVPVS